MSEEDKKIAKNDDSETIEIKDLSLENKDFNKNELHYSKNVKTFKF